MISNVHCLTSLPSGDGNFISALKRATKEELEQAIEFMEKSAGMHKGRIKACERELRKRNKEEKH